MNRLLPENFLSVKQLEALIVNRKKDINNEKISWLDTHEILIEKQQRGIIKIRNSIGGEFQTVNLERNGSKLDFKNLELDALWPIGKPLSKEKVKDLNDMLGLVPEDHHDFYRFLNVVPVEDFIDDADGFGQYVDFEIE